MLDRFMLSTSAARAMPTLNANEWHMANIPEAARPPEVAACGSFTLASDGTLRGSDHEVVRLTGEISVYQAGGSVCVVAFDSGLFRRSYGAREFAAPDELAAAGRLRDVIAAAQTRQSPKIVTLLSDINSGDWLAWPLPRADCLLVLDPKSPLRRAVGAHDDPVEAVLDLHRRLERAAGLAPETLELSRPEPA